jgi:hypothetical protein
VAEDNKKAGLDARLKSRSDENVKTFQRERPTRHRREEESDAALKSARVDIEGVGLVCNATCFMKGLRCLHTSEISVGP